MKPQTSTAFPFLLLFFFVSESLFAQVDTSKKLQVDPKIIQKNQQVLKPVVVNPVTAVVAPTNVIYVKADATGANNGKTWADAFTSLQSALTAAVAGKQIWIARGTYKPTTGLDRTASFRLKENVNILGGFAGTEASATGRNWRRNATMLDGDIGMTANNTDNSYNIIYAERISNTTTVEGIFIKNANADRNISTAVQSAGGGIYIEGAANTNAVFRNCEIADNRARWGGAVAIFDSELIRTLPGGANPFFDSCTFRNNNSIHDGGAVYIHSLKHSINPRFVNCVFDKNKTLDVSGGAVYHNATFARSSPAFEGCLFKDNSSNGGASVSHFLGSGRTEDMSRLAEANPVYTRCKFQYGGGLTISMGQGAIRTATYGRSYTITVKECIFEYTGAATTTTNLGWSGGAFYNWANVKSQLNLKAINCIFRKLQVNGNGGVVLNFANLKGTIRNDFTNCAFVQNYGCKGGVLYSTTSGDSTSIVSNFYNSIFYYNYFQTSTGCNEGEDIMLNTANTSANLFNCLTNKGDCNIMKGGAGRINCSGMIFATDPLFVDFANGNYNLQTASPAIDAGNDSYATSISTDITGSPRRSGTRVDIGPYEVRR